MADTKISALTGIGGESLDPAADVFVVVDTSVTTTKKVLVQDVFDAASTLTALTGSGVDTAADSLPIYDNSATAEKKILVDELKIAMAASESVAGTIEIATAAEIQTGSSNVLAVTPGRLRTAIGFSEGFTSTDQTITPSGSLTIAHGLTGAPKIVVMQLVCQTGENNYIAGDVLNFNGFSGVNGGNIGMAVWTDATNINVRFGGASALFVTVDASTGASVNITNANWKIRFTALG